jgi:hypothetical protein
MYHLETVSLSQVRPNPHRDLHTYPWIEEKVATLMRSIEDVGFWAGIIGRQTDDGYELAFGHHRVEAARRLGMAEVPLIIEALDDRRMLQFMGRENGEDYSANFLVMLNTWEGARGFVAKSMLKEKMRNNFRASPEPIDIARLLGWTERSHETGDRLTYVASACHAAHALIVAGHMSREDLTGLQVSNAREILTRAQMRVEQLEKFGARENRPRAEIEEAQAIVGKAAQITARQSREGRISQRQLRNELDLNAMRVSGAAPVRASPLFAVFGQGLCESIARILATDTTAERILEIEKALPNIELEEDHVVLRRLKHELNELSLRAQRAERRVSPNKVVPLKAVEQEA